MKRKRCIYLYNRLKNSLLLFPLKIGFSSCALARSCPTKEERAALQSICI